MQPPRKLRSGPKGKGSDAENASGRPSPENDGGGDFLEGDAPMDEDPPTTGQQSNRRSPRVAGMNPGSEGVDVERPAKRQRRSSADAADEVHSC